MPCLLALGAFFAPRLILFFLLLTGFIGQAYTSFLWPFLGFFCMPLTTLAYAAAMNWNHSVQGGAFFLVLIAALADLGVIGGGMRSRRYMPRLDKLKNL